jgi:hypothetical protein
MVWMVQMSRMFMIVSPVVVWPALRINLVQQRAYGLI